MKGGGGDVICAHPRTQGRSSSNARGGRRTPDPHSNERTAHLNQKIYDLTHNSQIYDGVSGRGVGLTFIPSMLPSTTLTSHLSSGGIYVWWGTPCLFISTVGDGRYSHPLLRYQGLTARDEEQRPPTTTAGVFPLITSLISQCYFDRR
jgi:hypothetical protein